MGHLRNLIFYLLINPSMQESSDPSKPITSDDVRSIFENLRKKKQRLL